MYPDDFTDIPLVLTGDPITADHENEQSADLNQVVSVLTLNPPKAPVRAATSAALSLSSSAGGVLMSNDPEPLVIDGVGVSANDRVLVKDEAGLLGSRNGLYLVTNAGSMSASWILTRTADMSIGAQVPGAMVYVSEGTANAGRVLGVTGAIPPFDLDTTTMTWSDVIATNVQPSLDTKLDKAGDNLTGDLTASSGVKIDGVDISVHAHTGGAGDAPNVPISSVTSLQSALDAKLDAGGGMLSGDLDMDGHTLSGLPTPGFSSEAATKGYVDSHGASAASSFVTIAYEAGLSNERALAGSSTVQVTDNGANSTVDLSVKKALDSTYLTDFNSAVDARVAAGVTTTTEGALINGATSKTTPVDADQVGLMDSAASNVLKKLSWANIKATLKTYFDTLYNLAALGGVPTSRTVNGHALSADVTVTKGDVGLGNCDNTSDASKPISTLTQAALDAKQPLASQLTALAALATTGVMKRTGTSAFSAGALAATDIPAMAAKVMKSVDQTLTNATATVLTWDSEEFDTNSIHDNATNNSRLTAPASGKYVAVLFVAFGSNNTGVRQIGLKVNGTFKESIIMPNNNAGQDYLSFTQVFGLTAGDYIEAWAYQASGGSLAASSSGTTLSLCWTGS